MEFVPENVIDTVMTQLENQKIFHALSTELIEKQPSIFAYLQSESFDILTEEEKDYLWYATLVVVMAIQNINDADEKLSIKDLEKLEEENYARVKDNMKFKEMANIFFDQFAQEDLLAFAEDMLVPDDDDQFISTVGRKVMFVSLKTIIDAYQEML